MIHTSSALTFTSSLMYTFFWCNRTSLSCLLHTFITSIYRLSEKWLLFCAEVFPFLYFSIQDLFPSMSVVICFGQCFCVSLFVFSLFVFFSNQRLSIIYCVEVFSSAQCFCEAPPPGLPFQPPKHPAAKFICNQQWGQICCPCLCLYCFNYLFLLFCIASTLAAYNILRPNIHGSTLWSNTFQLFLCVDILSNWKSFYFLVHNFELE